MEVKHMSIIEPYIAALINAGNLNKNQAKTLLYYCIMTWSDEPILRPILDIHGESGTGKNVIMKQIYPWCREAQWVNARNKTAAQLRDDLADKKTVFIEEADKTKEPKQCENWYQARYDETGKEMTYKVNTKRGYATISHDHYGYTVLHSQNAFQSIELDRRILRITIFKNSNRRYQSTESLKPKSFRSIAEAIDWNKPITGISNSALDVWLPLIRVARYFGDQEFQDYARKQIKSKVESDDDTKVFEPKGIVLSEAANLFIEALTNKTVHIPVTDIREELRIRGYIFSEREIAKYSRELGFTIVKPRNKAHIKVDGEARLKEILKNAGVYKEFYDSEGKLQRE